MNKLVKQVKLNNLKFLGYNKAEATWIKNFALELSKSEFKNDISKFNDLPIYQQNKILSNVKVNSDGHSGGTFTYTKTIIKSILVNNYQNWSTHCVHLNYNHVFRYFYSSGFEDLGNKLLTYKFANPDEHKILLEFKQKKNNSNNNIDQYDLLKLLKIVNKK